MMNKLHCFRMCKNNGLCKKSIKYVFPKNLKEEHDKLEKQYEINNQQLIDRKIKKRAKVLTINEYKNKEYKIMPAKSLEVLNDESKQQSNCVRTYAEDYSLGSCDIYFMRKTDSPESSCSITEWADGDITKIIERSFLNFNQ